MYRQVLRDMDLVEKVVREACAKSPDGKISQLDFMTHASRNMRYGTFSPMEVAIIFHYAGMGEDKRLRLRDFGSLLDSKWKPVTLPTEDPTLKTGSAMHEIAKVNSGRLINGHCAADSGCPFSVGVLLWSRRYCRSS